MKQSFLRLSGSALGAFVITICLYLLMIVLIRTDYEPIDETKTRDYAVVNKQEREVSVEREIKLKPKLKKTEKTPPAPPKNDYYVRKLPTITPKSQATLAIINPLKPAPTPEAFPSLPRSSDYLKGSGLQSKSRGSQGLTYGQSNAGTSGSRDGNGGINQCSISFTLLENDGVENLTWLNCIDGSIADEAENALHAWLRQKNKDYKALNARPGDSIEFIFQRQ